MRLQMSEGLRDQALFSLDLYLVKKTTNKQKKECLHALKTSYWLIKAYFF